MIRLLVFSGLLASALSAQQGPSFSLRQGEMTVRSVHLRNSCSTPQVILPRPQSDAPWLRLPASVNISGSASAPMSLTVDTSELDAGLYLATVDLLCPGCQAAGCQRQGKMSVSLRVRWRADQLESWRDSEDIVSGELLIFAAESSRELERELRRWSRAFGLSELGRAEIELLPALMVRFAADPEAFELPGALAAAEELSTILWAQPNFRYRSAGSGEEPYLDRQWNLPHIGALRAHRSVTGEGIVVAVLDSGVDRRHPDLAGRVKRSKDFTDSRYRPEQHGTAVAGILAAARNGVGTLGVAPGVRVLAVRVCQQVSETGLAEGRGDAVIQGLDYARNRAPLINLSLVGADDPAVKRSVERLSKLDILVIAAAGNDGKAGSVAYPAAYDAVLAVAAVAADGTLMQKSARGPEIDLAAPGQGILAPIPGDAYRALSGTSYAAPHVTAAAALLLERYPRLSLAQLRDALTLATSSKAGSPTQLDIPASLEAP